MARPRQLSDDQILQGARKCFLELGPSVSAELIAERLGISQPALFKRFKTKQNLLLTALRPPAVPPFTKRVDAGPTDQPLAQQVQLIAEEMLDFFLLHSPAMMTLAASGIPPLAVMEAYEQPPPLVALRSLSGFFCRARSMGLIGEIDPKEAALSLMGGVHVRVFLSHISSTTGTCTGKLTSTRNKDLSNFVELLMHGLLQEKTSTEGAE